MLKNLMNRIFTGKDEQRPLEDPIHSLGPWFLPREYPPAPFMSYGEWESRFNNAEFSVANMVAENIFPTQKVLNDIGDYVTGKIREIPAVHKDNPFIETLKIMSDKTPLSSPCVAVAAAWSSFFPQTEIRDNGAFEDAMKRLRAAALSLCPCKLGSRQAELMSRLYRDAQKLFSKNSGPYLRLFTSKFLQENNMVILWQKYAYDRGWIINLKGERQSQLTAIFMDLMRPI